MTGCDEVEGALGAYLDGELTGDAADQVAAHLGSCPGCTRSLEVRRSIGSRFAAEPVAPLPAGFGGQVLAAARHAGRHAGRPLRSPGALARLCRLFGRFLPTKGASVLEARAGLGPVPVFGLVALAFTAGVATTSWYFGSRLDALVRPVRLAVPDQDQLGSGNVLRDRSLPLGEYWAVLDGTGRTGAETRATWRLAVPGLIPLARGPSTSVGGPVEHEAWAEQFGSDPALASRVDYLPRDRVDPRRVRPGLVRTKGPEPALLWFVRPVPDDSTLSARVTLRLGRPSAVTLLARADRATLGDPAAPASGWFVRIHTATRPGRVEVEVGKDGKVARRRELATDGGPKRYSFELSGSVVTVAADDVEVGQVDLGPRHETPAQDLLGLVLEDAEVADLSVGLIPESREEEKARRFKEDFPPPRSPTLDDPDFYAFSSTRGPEPPPPRPRGAPPLPPPLPVPAAGADRTGTLLATALPGWELDPARPGAWELVEGAPATVGPEVARAWFRLPDCTTDAEVRLEARLLPQAPAAATRLGPQVALLADREKAGRRTPPPPAWSRLGGVAGGFDLVDRNGHGIWLPTGRLYGASNGWATGLPGPGAATGDTWHRLRVRKRGSLLAAWVDDTRVALDGLIPADGNTGSVDLSRWTCSSPTTSRWVALDLVHTALRKVEVEVGPLGP